MKKLLPLALVFFVSIALAQQSETGTTATSNDWNRGGNNNLGPSANNNKFGTFWNSPVYSYTDSNLRMKLNGTFNSAAQQYDINGFDFPQIQTNGYLGIGLNATTSVGNLWSNQGPYSLLHLNNNGSFPQELGFRPWMKGGITFTDNDDMMYIGPRRNGQNDVTDLVINWSDNATSSFGPDNVVFCFTTNDGSANNDLNGDSPNGREVLRLTAGGAVGIGPRFNNTNQPQSLLHLNSENAADAWLQITNQTNTGQFNGLQGTRLGISGLNSYMINQENGHLIFSTNTSTGNLGNERMRISQIGASGIPASTVAVANTTRVAISTLATNPVTAPRSLLHLGENISGTGDGYRDWMNIGSFTAAGTDNVYLGLKREGSEDRHDAVLAWGDNEVADANGPDYLRFVFARNTASPGGAVSGAFDGLEVGRFTPSGQLGIGNFYNGGLGLPTETIDVDGKARFRTLPLPANQDNSLNQIMVVDANGTTWWRDAATLGGTVAADNGLSIDPFNPGVVQLGEDISNWTGVSNLTTTRYTFMRDNNLQYGGQGIMGKETSFVLGPIEDTTRYRGKLHVHHMPPNDFIVDQFNRGQSAGAYIRNSELFDPSNMTQVFAGVRGIADGRNQGENVFRLTHYGGYFQAYNNRMNNYGVYGESIPPIGVSHKLSGGGRFYALSETGSTIGADCSGQRGQDNIGVSGLGTGYGPNSNSSVGGYFRAEGSGSVNYGVYSEIVSGQTNAWAGYFNGDVFATGAYVGSDESLKSNINELDGALNIITQLNPVTYYYNDLTEAGLNLPTVFQYGLLANEVREVLPNVTREFSTHLRDTSDNSINITGEYLAINYTELIPILIKAVQELKIQNDNLQDQINSCCQSSDAARYNSEFAILNNLENEELIVLGQNSPNPFAERTEIEIYIPVEMTEAQLIFYNEAGQAIQTHKIHSKGITKVTVYGNNLSSGVYTYTLVVDGQPIDSKRMVVAK